MTDTEMPINSTRGEETVEIVSIALQAIPYAGGVLSSTATYFLEKRKNRRLNQFLMGLAEDLQSVQDKINDDCVNTDEFQDLTEDIFSKAAETRQKEKLDALRGIFLNTVLAENPDYDEAIEMADLIYRWQPRHIILLKILSNPKAADAQKGNIVGEGGGFSTSINQILSKLLPEWDTEQIDRTWQELYDDRIHRTPGTKTMITDRGIYQLENRLTEFGYKVANYLRHL